MQSYHTYIVPKNIMAHFAKIENIEGTNKVTWVIVIPNEHETRGNEYINELGMEGTWIQCSYNTREGKHKYGSTPFRKNFPSPGFTYDTARDAFIPPKPEKNPSFILDESTCTWVPPIPYPMDRYVYVWNEAEVEWQRDEEYVKQIPNSWTWNEDTKRWQAPIPYPRDGLPYDWVEETQSWRLMTELKNDLI